MDGVRKSKGKRSGSDTIAITITATISIGEW